MSTPTFRHLSTIVSGIHCIGNSDMPVVSTATSGTNVHACVAWFARSAHGAPNIEHCTFPHLDKLVREGALGTLAVRDTTGEGAAGSG